MTCPTTTTCSPACPALSSSFLAERTVTAISFPDAMMGAATRRAPPGSSGPTARSSPREPSPIDRNRPGMPPGIGRVAPPSTGWPSWCGTERQVAPMPAHCLNDARLDEQPLIKDGPTTCTNRSVPPQKNRPQNRVRSSGRSRCQKAEAEGEWMYRASCLRSSQACPSEYTAPPRLPGRSHQPPSHTPHKSPKDSTGMTTALLRWRHSRSQLPHRRRKPAS